MKLALAFLASFAFTGTAAADVYPRPAAYPFAGKLEQRQSWQTKALRHYRADVRAFYRGYLRLADGSRTSAKSARAQERLRIVRRELVKTRAALVAAAYVAPATVSATGNAGGCSWDVFYYGLQFSECWLAQYPWLDGSVASQIRAAEIIGSQSSGDPWPSCPDPYDGSGASWDDTVACENGGSW